MSIKGKHEGSKEMAEDQQTVETEAAAAAAAAAEVKPLSPASRLLQSPDLNCAIIVTLGCKTRGNASAVIEGLKHTLVNHPRFSSRPEVDRKNKGRLVWVRTKVKVEDHVIVPDIDRDQIENPDQFLEDYLSNISTIPMDMFKPLWELHLLDIKTSDAESIGILKIHHSLGDGMSLFSLFLACTRKTSDPQALPTVAVKENNRIALSSARNSFRMIWWLVLRVWLVVKLMLNTCVGIFMFVATLCFLRDTETPIMAKSVAVRQSPKRFVHRIFSLDDIKLVKSAMKMTVNDVLLGVTQAGLSRYLRRRYDQETVTKSEKYMGRIRLRAAVIVNLRPNTGIEDLADMMANGSKCRWGNWIGYVLLPFSVGIENNPLEYIRRAKATIDRKKNSLEALFSYASLDLSLKLFGIKAAEAIVRRVFGNTTFSFSNVIGPKEEIAFYGHPISYIAPTVIGHPHALTVHYQSYANKMIVSIAVDPTVIPDPHRMCDDFEESLKIIKSSVLDCNNNMNV